MPVITTRRLSPISPKPSLKVPMRRLNSSARSSRCCSWPSSQAMRYFLPAISTLTSGIVEDAVHSIHGNDEASRDLGVGLLEAPRALRGLFEVAGEARSLRQQLLGVGLDARLRAEARLHHAEACLEAGKGTVELRRGGLDRLVGFGHGSPGARLSLGPL